VFIEYLGRGVAGLVDGGIVVPGHVVPTGPFWAAWVNEPLLLLGLGVTAALYWVGWCRLSRVAHGGAASAGRATAFFAGLVTLLVALLSPIAAYSERLFFMHMIQHLLLLLIAPPLLLMGKPLVPVLWGLPTGARRQLARLMLPGRSLSRIGDFLTKPILAVVAFVLTIAIWHVPPFYDAAQGRTITHDLEHLMFFGVALLYWWPVVHPAGGRRRLSYAWAIPYLVPPFVEGMLLGILLTFADTPLYRTYAAMEPTWGISTLGDQQIGGLVMWIPGGLFFLIPVLGILTAIFRQEDERANERARVEPRGPVGPAAVP
jgi:cytochrome c oxidase assembly factor CtaG